ncbi:hypothetical protein C0Q70_07974 [Pomacea canaliculata]|uniref:Uncharacterized protein n=1 Tax=Pomacea canaliculata TaxID=400727 RepID=A0A2T7PGJ4_POMCA|nr:uncharacterized protein LOC112563157 [Pomacea canaliculata]PVD32534.1 hypothetical protein C0Q70_07974 [Pomacea canaliculata]
MATRSNRTQYSSTKINRAEFDDGLLRNNLRHDNRLVHELQAVEKAQRIIAKTLDHEKQWYRQKLASSSSSTAASLPRRKKTTPDLRTSLYVDARSAEGGRVTESVKLIPDFVYQGGRQRWSTGSGPPASGEVPEGGNRGDLGGAEVHVSSEDTARDKKAGSRPLLPDAGEQKLRQGSSKRDEKKFSEGGKPAPDRRSAGTRLTDSPEAEAGFSRHSPNTTHERSRSKVETKRLKQKAAQSQPSVHTEDHSPPKLSSDLPVQPRLPPGPPDGSLVADVNWDGRQRYTNVWDTLSTPRHVATSRSVRNRLHREFSSLSDRSTKGGSK